MAGGVVLYVMPLVIGGVEQGMKLRDANIPFADANSTALIFLRVSTTGQLLILLGALCLLLNIFVITMQWKLGLVKTLMTFVKSPLETSEVKL